MRRPIPVIRPSEPTRRRFLLSAAALGALPLLGCGGGDDDEPIVATTSGSFRGQAAGRTVRFLGVPYAQPPVGALRFRAPQPVQPTNAVIDAFEFGAASLQTIPPTTRWIYPTPAVQDESCLTLNVWSPSLQGKAPVLVWLHGGGFRTGATSMPLMDGQWLAEHGLVVVTVNHRLGALGLLAHPAFTDPTNGSFANWQQQDMAAALQWVRQNIAAFGGDADNVCLIGQSGGAKSAALLAQNPAVRPTSTRCSCSVRRR
jgi:para-nitrobenzyl esterase